MWQDMEGLQNGNVDRSSYHIMGLASIRYQDTKQATLEIIYINDCMHWIDIEQ